MDTLENLSRRERQIMDILHRRPGITASQIQEALTDDLSNSSVRTFLRILEEKGMVRHDQDGPRFLYSPVLAPEKAKSGALKHLLRTFFNDSPEGVVAALLELQDARLSPKDLDRMAALIQKAREEGR